MEENKEIRVGTKIGALIVVVVLGALIYFGAGNFAVGPVTPDSPLRFLVNESVSASAPIVVRIPDGIPAVPANSASKLVSLDPVLRGTWSAGKDEREIVFKPANKLTLNKRYQISVAVASSPAANTTGTSASTTGIAASAGSQVLSTDFLVAPDPEVLAIF